MGTVYEAVQLHLHKRVAVKIMVPELAENPEALGRFRREVEITLAAVAPPRHPAAGLSAPRPPASPTW